MGSRTCTATSCAFLLLLCTPLLFCASSVQAECTTDGNLCTYTLAHALTDIHGNRVEWRARLRMMPGERDGSFIGMGFCLQLPASFAVPIVLGDISGDPRLQPLLDAGLARLRDFGRFGAPLDCTVFSASGVSDQSAGVRLFLGPSAACNVFYLSPRSNASGRVLFGSLCELRMGRYSVDVVAAMVHGTDSLPARWSFDHRNLAPTKGFIGYLSLDSGPVSLGDVPQIDTSLVIRHVYDAWHGSGFNTRLRIRIDSGSWSGSLSIIRLAKYPGHLDVPPSDTRQTPLASVRVACAYDGKRLSAGVCVSDITFRPGTYAGESQRRLITCTADAAVELSFMTLSASNEVSVDWTPSGSVDTELQMEVAESCTVGNLALMLSQQVVLDGYLGLAIDCQVSFPLGEVVAGEVALSYGKGVITPRLSWKLEAAGGSLQISLGHGGRWTISYAISRGA